MTIKLDNILSVNRFIKPVIMLNINILTYICGIMRCEDEALALPPTHVLLSMQVHFAKVLWSCITTVTIETVLLPVEYGTEPFDHPATKSA